MELVRLGKESFLLPSRWMEVWVGGSWTLGFLRFEALCWHGFSAGIVCPCVGRQSRRTGVGEWCGDTIRRRHLRLLKEARTNQ
jgi:hypothetical protein